jgi:DNA-binding NtrC family response regulator
MDVRMPVTDGLEATRRIKREMPRTSVVMVTMHENPDYLFEAVKAGAAGYVSKDASGERLLGAVRRTLEGESPLNQEAGDEAYVTSVGTVLIVVAAIAADVFSVFAGPTGALVREAPRSSTSCCSSSRLSVRPSGSASA